MSGFSKADLKRFIDRLPDDDAKLAKIVSIVNNNPVPYIKGAKEPVMRLPVEPKEKNGLTNPDYFRELRDIAIEHSIGWQNYHGHQWPALESQLKLVYTMAQQHGIDLAAYAPESLESAYDDLFSAAPAFLDDFERRLTDMTELAVKQLPIAKKKRWLRTLRQVRALRESCRNAIPEKVQRSSAKIREAWEATHALRYMLWVMRSSLLSDTGQYKLMEMPEHLIISCMVISLARKYRVTQRIDGALVQLAPGHGKTNFVIADRALWINLNPSLPASVVHHNKERAQRRFESVRDHFLPGTDEGRRRSALFPEITINSLYTNRSKMYVFHNGKQECGYKEGNYCFRGVHQAGEGDSFIEMDLDDIVDRKEADEPTTREQTNRAMFKTWFPRLRGLKSFWKCVGTCWHEEDFTMQLRKGAARGDFRMGYYGIACGGPETGFMPIWPDVCDSQKLESIFARIGPHAYACQYQNNPSTEYSRRISRLHFYDWNLWHDKTNAPEEWRRFWDTALYLFAMDPSGTEHKKSNMAGILQAAFGVIRVPLESGGMLEVPKLVFTEFDCFHANQKRIADTVYARNNALMAQDGQRTVNAVLIETASGYHATADLLEDAARYPGFPHDKIVRRIPGSRAKVQRFLDHVAHFEVGDVLFPGQWTFDDEGKRVLESHSAWQEVRSQLMSAGSSIETCMMDCAAMLLHEVAHDIVRMREDATNVPHVRESQGPYSYMRKRAYFDQMVKKNQGIPADFRHKAVAFVGA